MAGKLQEIADKLGQITTDVGMFTKDLRESVPLVSVKLRPQRC